MPKTAILHRPPLKAVATVTCRRCFHKLHIRASMYVPSDSFGGMSPERRAAQSLQTFFTFVAAKVVMSQLEGIGRGDLGAYNAEGATVLRRFLGEVPMRDGNAWCQQLMAENEMLGVRILEVRAAYAAQDFEWDQLKRLAIEGLEAENTSIMRKHAQARFASMLSSSGGSGSSSSSEASSGGSGSEAGSSEGGGSSGGQAHGGGSGSGGETGSSGSSGAV